MTRHKRKITLTEFAFPFSGTSPGQAGPYSAELFRLYIESLFTGLNRANAGVLLLSGDGVDEPLTVKQTAPASAQVQITPGAALVNGGWYYTNDDVNVTIAANTSGNPRIDLLILRFNATAQTITLVDLQGTPAGSPVPPTLTQTDTQYEIPLAQIAVANLFATIVTANINNTVRSFARLAQYQEGGTGQSSYTVRDKLMGQSDGSLAVVKLSACSIENRNDPSSDLGSGSFQKLQIQEKNDPDALISVASDVITFAKAGWYTMTGFHADYTGITTTSTIYFRLRDTLSSTTLWVSDTFNTPSGQTNRDFLGSASFNIASDNTTVEFQVFRGAGTTRFESSAANPGGGETEKTIQADFIRWG